MAITRIDVRTKSIQELMDVGEIPSGRYWLPSFQRSYVWDSDKIKELLDSIFKNYPIGSVILWRPSSQVAADLDPTAVPLVDTGLISQEPHFIIDGQQRITSLVLLFNGCRITRGGNKVMCDPIAYDPNSDTFIKSIRKGHDFSKIISAFCKHDMDALAELKSQTRPDVFEKIRSKALQILKYPISQYVMETDVEDEKTFADMANAFIRINKEGVKIGTVELMLSFMAGTVRGELKQKITQLDKELSERFEIDMQPIIRFVFSNFGLTQTQLSKAKQFTSNIEKIRAISSEEHDRVLHKSGKALRITLDFLEAEAGIKNARLLPYQTPLVLLASYFYKRGLESVADLSTDERRDILNWFILVSFLGHYSVSTDSRLTRDLRIIAEADCFPLNALIENMPGRHAISYDDIRRGLDQSVLVSAGRKYLFLLYILLVRQQADDWSGSLLASRTLTDLERHHIFPQEHLRTILDLDDVDPDDVEVTTSNLGNVTWILDSVNSGINDSDPQDYLPQYIRSIEHHFVPIDPKYWSKEAYEKEVFQQYRVREIYLAAKKFFAPIFTDENPQPIQPPSGDVVDSPGGRAIPSGLTDSTRGLYERFENDIKGFGTDVIFKLRDDGIVTIRREPKKIFIWVSADRYLLADRRKDSLKIWLNPGINEPPEWVKKNYRNGKLNDWEFYLTDGNYDQSIALIKQSYEQTL